MNHLLRKKIFSERIMKRVHKFSSNENIYSENVKNMHVLLSHLYVAICKKKFNLSMYINNIQPLHRSNFYEFKPDSIRYKEYKKIERNEKELEYIESQIRKSGNEFKNNDIITIHKKFSISPGTIFIFKDLRHNDANITINNPAKIKVPVNMKMQKLSSRYKNRLKNLVK